MRAKEDFIKDIKENEGIIYKITKVYSKDPEDQKDLYQEIVYQLWKSYESFKGNSKISTWIYRIALNTSITYFKKGIKLNNRVPLDEALLNVIEHVDSTMEERLVLLYKRIQELNVIEKGIVLLYLEGKNYDEMAEITGFSSTNIGTRLNRVKNKLKKQLKK